MSPFELFKTDLKKIRAFLGKSLKIFASGCTLLLYCYCLILDLPEAKNTTEVTDRMCLHKYRDREWFIQDTRATTGEGVVDGFIWLARNIKNKSVLS